MDAGSRWLGISLVLAAFAVPVSSRAQGTGQTPAELHKRGLDRARNRQFDEAIADFTEAIRLNPKGAESYTDRGTVHAERGNLDKAIADLTEAIRLDPKVVRAFVYRGQIQELKGETDKAAADFSEAIRLSPKDADIHVYRARTWGLRGEYDKAIADLTEAIRLDPKHSYYYYFGRGDAWAAKGDQARARADYRQADILKRKR